ncbi:MAG: hypothetical protein HY907_07950 [Deltaproteobacteria bacterium]|nr:hypothetical protein [Deltaproteobacteria bacterium]
MTEPVPEPPSPATLAPVVLVVGKGGVGRTTVAAGLAALAAGTRGRAAYVEFGDGASGRRALAGAPRGLEHVVIRSAEALQRAAASLFGSSLLARLVLGNFAMRPLVRVAPAVREVAVLEAVRQVAAERPGVRVVVDMPATGHSVAWLRLPRQGLEVLGPGPVREFCARLARELLAPARSSIVVVTLPERLVLEETRELCASIAQEAGLAVDRVAVNRLPAGLPPAALAAARTLAGRPGPVGAAAAALAGVLEGREAAVAEAQAALTVIGQRAVGRLPEASHDPSAREVAAWLRSEGAA